MMSDHLNPSPQTEEQQITWTPPGLGASLPRILWDRRNVIALVTVLILAAGVFYLLVAKRVYTGTARLYLEQALPRILTESDGVILRSKDYLYTQAELIKSSPILMLALNQPGIQELESLSGARNPVRQLRKLLEVSVGEKDGIINVTCQSTDPDEAATFANAVVNAYVDFYTTRKRSTAEELMGILRKEKQKADAELSAKLQAMLKFKQENKTISLESDQSNVVMERLTRLSEALTASQLESIQARALYEAALKGMNDPTQVRQLAEAHRAKLAVASQDEAQLQSAINRLQAQLASEEENTSTSAPAKKILQTEIAELEKRLAVHDRQVAEAYLGMLRQQLEAVEEKQRELQTAFDEQHKLAQETNVKAAEYAILEAELKRIESLCDSLDSHIREINLTEGTAAMHVTVLEFAEANKASGKPKRSTTLLASLLLGVLVGVGAALLLDWKDPRLQTAETAAVWLGMRVLAVVPRLAGRSDTAAEWGQAIRRRPLSATAEAFRAARTAVCFGLGGQKVRTILVTSPQAGEGKSAMVSNLAIALAQAGSRTLVLDADFRDPIQHEVFSLGHGKGLSDVLAGKATLEEVTRTTDVPNLSVVPCGTRPSNPSEVLSSQTLVDTLTTLCGNGKYDYILIDSADVTSVADARILAARADATVLVLQAGKSTRTQARQALEDLAGVGARVLGLIVNDRPQGKDWKDWRESLQTRASSNFLSSATSTSSDRSAE
jgi:capsular exopolysaccharide synthesis family protein